MFSENYDGKIEISGARRNIGEGRGAKRKIQDKGYLREKID
jgi:hypothetical protein